MTMETMAQDPTDETENSKHSHIFQKQVEEQRDNLLEGKCAVTSNIPPNRYETRVASNLRKCLSE